MCFVYERLVHLMPQPYPACNGRAKQVFFFFYIFINFFRQLAQNTDIILTLALLSNMSIYIYIYIYMYVYMYIQTHTHIVFKENKPCKFFIITSSSSLLFPSRIQLKLNFYKKFSITFFLIYLMDKRNQHVLCVYCLKLHYYFSFGRQYHIVGD